MAVFTHNKIMSNYMLLSIKCVRKCTIVQSRHHECGTVQAFNSLMLLPPIQCHNDLDMSYSFAMYIIYVSTEADGDDKVVETCVDEFREEQQKEQKQVGREEPEKEPEVYTHTLGVNE